MKKILFFVLMAAAAVSAQAQFYVGGTFGVSAETTRVSGESSTNSVYSLSPEVGYQINKVWTVGLSVGSAYMVNDGSDDITLWDVSPYVRATFIHAGAVDFFAEAAFSYEYADIKYESVSVDGWGIGLRPGILVKLTDHLRLVGRTTIFQYAATGDKPYKVKQTGFSLSPNNVEMGVQFNF